MKLCLLLAVSVLAFAQAPRFQRVFSPSGPKPGGPYSPGLWTGERYYVAGQGARTGGGELPSTPEAQIRQVLNNVKMLIEAGGLTMEHVVFSQVYYEDLKHYELFNKIWREYFPGYQPARATAQAAFLPGPTPFEVNAIAVRDKSAIQSVELPGSKSPVPLSPMVMIKDRAYISGILGRDADAGKIPASLEGQAAMAFDRLRRVLGAGKLNTRHLIALNVFTTAAMPDAVAQAGVAKAINNRADVAITYTRVAALPFGTNIGLHGVATRSLRKRTRVGKCIGADGTVYCGQFAADDYRQALTDLTGALGKFPGAKPNIVATYVQLDDVKEFAAMNQVYAEIIKDPLPTRTTTQPAPVGQSPKFRIAVMAEQ
jgi:enamine deaminase RidA (YjgF/YER057c/UK114 family)